MTTPNQTFSWNNFNGHALNGYNNNVGFVSSYVEILDEDGNPTGCWRPIVNSQDLEQMTVELQCGYGCKSFVSYDMFFRPVSMDGDECGEGQCFPKLTKLTPDMTCSVFVGMIMTDPDTGETTHTVGAEIPLVQTLECIDWEDVNPVQNPEGNTYDHIPANRSDTPEIGHDFEMLTRCGTGEYGTPEGGLLMVPASDDATKSDYANDYRLMALRGPIMITGWGYTCDGYPVPNKVDVEGDMRDGMFVFDDTRDKQKFADGHLRNPFTWVTAPLDLRYDYKKNVWTTAGCAEYMGDHALVCVELCDDVTTSTPLANGLVCDGTEFTQSNGIPIANPIIQFEPKINMDKGTKVTLIRTYDCYEQLCTPVQREEGTCPSWTKDDVCVGNRLDVGGSITDACNVRLGKNLEISESDSSSGSSGSSGEVLISAGICFAESEECVPCGLSGSSNDPLSLQPIEEDRTYCEIELGRGLCGAVDDVFENRVIISTQINYENSDSCVLEGGDFGTFCDIEFGKGLAGGVLNPDDPDADGFGVLRLGISWDVGRLDECIDDDEADFYTGVNCLTLGKGLSARFNEGSGGGSQGGGSGAGDCNELEFGVGIFTDKNQDCATNSSSNLPIPAGEVGTWCCLRLGRGIDGEVDDDGTLLISSGILIENCDDPDDPEIPIHKIRVKENLYDAAAMSVDPQDCRVLDFCEIGGQVDCESLATEFGVPDDNQPYALTITRNGSSYSCEACRIIKCQDVQSSGIVFTPPGDGN